MNETGAPASATAILFVCGLNSVRSPMAAGLMQRMFGKAFAVRSAGVHKEEIDPFAVAAMAEIGIDVSGHRPTTLEEIEDLEGLDFDLVITLSPEAHHRALELTRAAAIEVEYWPTADPTHIEGNRGQRLDAYRAVRDQLQERIAARFAAGSGNP